MDIAVTLNKIKTLSIEDRIRLVQAIWDSIAAEQNYPDITELQKQELDSRITHYEANPDNVLTWEEIKASADSDRFFPNQSAAKHYPYFSSDKLGFLNGFRL